MLEREFHHIFFSNTKNIDICQTFNVYPIYRFLLYFVFCNESCVLTLDLCLLPQSHLDTKIPTNTPADHVSRWCKSRLPRGRCQFRPRNQLNAKHMKMFENCKKFYKKKFGLIYFLNSTSHICVCERVLTWMASHTFICLQQFCLRQTIVPHNKQILISCGTEWHWLHCRSW